MKKRALEKRHYVAGILPVAAIAMLAASQGTVSCGMPADEDTEESLATRAQDIWATRWENLGGNADNDPAIASWEPGRLDVFWRSTSGALHHRWYPHSGAWSPIEDLGGAVAGSPSAVSSDVNRIDVFYFNSSGNLVRRYINGNVSWSWLTETITVSASADKPSTSNDGTAVASWTAGRLDVFWRGSDGHLKHVWKVNDATAWTGVEDLGGTLTSAPAAVSSDNLKIDVFWRGANAELQHKWFPSCSGCNTWASAVARTGNNEVDGDPAVASWDANRLDVFWRRGGALAHSWKSGVGSNVGWNGFIEDLGGSLAAGPDAVSFESGRIDVVAQLAAADDIGRFTWQMTDQTTAWYNDVPPAPTVIADDINASWLGSGWEFSAAACPSGAFAVAGRSGSTRNVWSSASATATAAPAAATVASGGANTGLEDDSAMVRGPGGDLWLLRGLLMSTNCGATTPDACVADGCGTEYRSGAGLWRSNTCGQSWTLENTFDPASASYGNGVYGGGPCWGGWDRDELYYDYWSDRLFVTFNGETDDVPDEQDARAMFALRSPVGGTGTYSFNRLNNLTAQPYMMTSLPGMFFIFSCEGGDPTLRWIDPNSASWTSNNANLDALANSGAIKSTTLTSEQCMSGLDGEDGSETVTRVGTYFDDSGVQWWTVRVGFLSNPFAARVITLRVNAAGNVQQIASRDLVTPNPAFTNAQLTAIEPDPAQNISAGVWNGENTTLYYWRALSTLPGSEYRIYAAAVRDATGWGDTFQVASGTGLTKRADFARGAFYYDTSAPETPLRYIMTWVAGDGNIKREVVALPRGRNNN